MQLTAGDDGWGHRLGSGFGQAVQPNPRTRDRLATGHVQNSGEHAAYSELEFRLSTTQQRFLQQLY